MALYLGSFIGYLTVILLDKSQLDYLSTIKPGLSIYCAIETALVGIQLILSIRYFSFAVYFKTFMTFDFYFTYLLVPLKIANSIFGCTQYYDL